MNPSLSLDALPSCPDAGEIVSVRTGASGPRSATIIGSHGGSHEQEDRQAQAPFPPQQGEPRQAPQLGSSLRPSSRRPIAAPREGPPAEAGGPSRAGGAVDSAGEGRSGCDRRGGPGGCSTTFGATRRRSKSLVMSPPRSCSPPITSTPSVFAVVGVVGRPPSRRAAARLLDDVADRRRWARPVIVFGHASSTSTRSKSPRSSHSTWTVNSVGIVGSGTRPSASGSTILVTARLPSSGRRLRGVADEPVADRRHVAHRR